MVGYNGIADTQPLDTGSNPGCFFSFLVGKSNRSSTGSSRAQKLQPARNRACASILLSMIKAMKYGSPQQVDTLHTKTRGEGRGEPPVIDSDFDDDGWTSAIPFNDKHCRIPPACQIGASRDLDGSPAFEDASVSKPPAHCWTVRVLRTGQEEDDILEPPEMTFCRRQKSARMNVPVVAQNAECMYI